MDPNLHEASVPDINRVQDHQHHAVNSMSAEPRNRGPRRKSTVGRWTKEEDAKLTEAVRQHNGKNWKKIATYLLGRTAVQCLHRWQKVLDPNLFKGPWTKEEDDLILALVEKFGEKNWSSIAYHLQDRIGKQCRERWNNYLKPGIIRTPWTEQEDLILIEAHAQCGNKWAQLTKLLPGRSENAIKNRWNCTLRRRVNGQNGSRRRPATDPSTSGSSDLKDSEDVARPQVIVVGEIDYLSSFGAAHQDASIAIHKPTTERNSRDCLTKGAKVTVPVEESSSSPRRDSFEAPKQSETTPAGAITEGSALLPTPLHNTVLSLGVSFPESMPKSAPEMFPDIPLIMKKRRLQAPTAAAAADGEKGSSGCVTMQVSPSSPPENTVNSIKVFGIYIKYEFDSCQ